MKTFLMKVGFLRWFFVVITGLIALLILIGCNSQQPSQNDPPTEPTEQVKQVVDEAFLAKAKEVVEAATSPSTEWNGPTNGPQAQPDKRIVYVSADQHNGGIAGVSEGVKEAAEAIGWKFELIDATAQGVEHRQAFEQALALNPDGIVIGGIDVFELLLEVESAHKQGVAVVGWHVAPDPGPTEGLSLFTNITTPSNDVAEIAAYYAIAQSNGTAGVVIFTDTRFQIAVAKSNAMADVIRQCQSCELFTVEDVPLNQTQALMPQVINTLLEQYGEKWTYTLGINDLYFDDAIITLETAEIPPTGRLESLSAGDGSVSAYDRIRSQKYQLGTVPEPLLLHGWQLVDELNRAFAGEEPSNYISPVHLVTPDNINFDGGPDNHYDPDNGYRDQYRAIWNK